MHTLFVKFKLFELNENISKLKLIIKNLIELKLDYKLYTKRLDKAISKKLKLKLKLQETQKTQETLIINLDTETDGIHDKNKGRQKLIQVAYTVTNSKFETVLKQDILVNDGSNSVDLAKKISLSNIKTKGKHILDVLNILKKDFEKCNYVICHNIRFDMTMLKRYFHEHNITCKWPKYICTMVSTKNLVNAVNKNNNIKNPTLDELYNYYFKEELNENRHLADYDVEVMIKCLKEITKTHDLNSLSEITLRSINTEVNIIEKCYLKCKYEDHKEVKSLGAIWDSESKKWWIDKNKINNNFNKFI
jgi:DNA polymerase III epsilon subunit-like protein